MSREFENSSRTGAHPRTATANSPFAERSGRGEELINPCVTEGFSQAWPSLSGQTLNEFSRSQVEGDSAQGHPAFAAACSVLAFPLGLSMSQSSFIQIGKLKPIFKNGV